MSVIPKFMSTFPAIYYTSIPQVHKSSKIDQIGVGLIDNTSLLFSFCSGFHEREVYSAHKEIVIAVNDKDSMTGTSGVIAWELGDQNIHLIVMWTIPYNLNFYDAHFAFGMVHLTTKFTRDMLPYWYQRMYKGDDGGTYKSGEAGESLVFKHHHVFILGHLEKDSYQPVLNISVMPWSTGDLAPSIWHKLYLQTVREREAQPYSAATASLLHMGWAGKLILALVLAVQVTLGHCCLLQGTDSSSHHRKMVKITPN